MADRKTTPKTSCDCVARVNETLEPRGLAVDVTLFRELVIISTHKLLPTVKRTYSAALVASFCPFCGRPYATEVEEGNKAIARAARKSSRHRKALQTARGVTK